MANWSIPQRYINIKLFRGVNQTSDNLLANMNVDTNISFSTSSSMGGQAYECNVTIHGLTVENMCYLATSYNVYTQNQNRNNTIKIDAGYDNKHSVIYRGVIIDSTPSTNSADFSIDLKCVNNYIFVNEENKDLTFPGKKNLKEICQNLADNLNVPLKFDIKDDIEIENYYIRNMTLMSAIRDLSKATGVNIWLGDDGVLYAKNVNEALSDEVYNIDYTKMIGSPRPDALGCDVSVRMDCKIKAGQKVKLTSKRFPSVDGEYYIQSYSHSGETRGNKWQTDLRLTKTGLFVKG